MQYADKFTIVVPGMFDFLKKAYAENQKTQCRELS
jgi:hypothetical protein